MSGFLPMLMSVALLSGDPQQTKMLRLAVVDNSGSMAGERIAVVKSELGKILKQLPPSKEYPLVLVSFSSSADKPQVFTDLPSAERAIAKLDGGGWGTSIAAGLAEGIKELQARKSVADVWVLLYSDGEDSNTAGILGEETKLDALFAERQKTGLGQTVVFCKRWGNANAILQQRMTKRGKARVIDAGEANLKPVTFNASISVEKVQWSTEGQGELTIDVRPRVVVKSDGAPPTIAPLRFRCTNAGAAGNVQFDVPAGATGAPVQTIRVAVPPGKSAEVFDLIFTVKPPEAQLTGDALVLPLLPENTIRVAVTPPPRNARYQFAADCDLPEAAEWTDPLARRAAFSVIVKVNIQADGIVDQQPLRVRIQAPVSAKIIKGITQLEAPGPGRFNVPLTLELTPYNPAAELTELRYKLQLTLAAEGGNGVTFEPGTVNIERSDLRPPAATKTRIAAWVQSISKPEWVDLAKSQAGFEAQTIFEVDGPIPANTQVTVVSPGEVSHLTITPRKLQQGRQSVKFEVVATIAAAPRSTPIVFGVVPPRDAGAVKFVAGPPLRLSVLGPRPTQLMLVEENETKGALVATVPDNVSVVSFEVLAMTPALRNPKAARGLQAELRGGTPLHLTSAGTVDLYRPTKVVAALPTGEPSSFFFDSVHRGKMEVVPAPKTSAVVGSRYPVEVTVQAPFKRLAFWLGISLSALLTVVMLIRMYVRLRSAD